ncbi:unnamed protein product [Hydatigera taeniaeformis]|uniref:GCM domain-containing protein n=1 Tax=Hydatigena taeniaeformis TaxID=6205 RepID=A0A0R3X694_HYDTA|nr:unnamed protein product [Hydatigera taeniaeformis]
MYFDYNFVETRPLAYSTPHSINVDGYVHHQCPSSIFCPGFVQHNQQQSKPSHSHPHSQVVPKGHVYKDNEALPICRSLQELPTSTSGSTSWDINDKQLPKTSTSGKQCVRKGCPGQIYLHPCRGNEGYPVTHFWREVGDLVFFQAKGTHGHLRPNAKAARSKPNRSKSSNPSTDFTSPRRPGLSETTISSVEMCFSPQADTYFGTHLPSFITERNVATTNAPFCYPSQMGVRSFDGGIDGTSLCSPPPSQLTLSMPQNFHRCPTVSSQLYQNSSSKMGSHGMGPSNGSWCTLALHLPSSVEETSDFSPWAYHVPEGTSGFCSDVNTFQNFNYQHRYSRPLRASSWSLQVHDAHGHSSTMNSSYLPYDGSPLQSSGASSHCSSNQRISR